MIHGFFLLIVFLCELAAIAAYGYWGFQLDTSVYAKWTAGIGIPVLVAVVWGLFLSPKASFAVPLALQIALKVLVFGLAAAALYATGRPRLAMFFAACVLISHAMDSLLGDA